MLKKKYFLWIGLLMGLCYACNNGATSTTITTPPTDVQITATAVVTTPITSDIPVQVNLASEREVDACIECHTDQQMLIDTAKPQEEVVSESKGEG